MLQVQSKQTLSMYTRDRVRLDADVYYPIAEGNFPVLLMRQPYGRAIASTVVYAHPAWYAAQGYIVVIQDVRGRGTSEGEFKLFAHEIEDGSDAVQWAANLPNSTGNVGMYGFSYQGMTQLYAAAAKPPGLKTLCPAMVAYDLYHDWAYENGAFCLQSNLSWGLQLATETARRKGDIEAHHQLTRAAKHLTFENSIPARSPILESLAPDSFYHEWLEHDEPDEYWHQLSPKNHLQDVDLPMLHIGGWFDTFLRGTLNLYQAMASRSQFRQQLLVGPWAHLPWARRVGAQDFGTQANNPCDRLQIRWFDHFLKGKDTDLLDELPVQLFEMGTNDWRFFSAWNFENRAALCLASTGLAAMDDQDGVLQPFLGEKRQASQSVSRQGEGEQREGLIAAFGMQTNEVELASHPLDLEAAADLLVHDPWRPVPSLGGHAAFPSGPQERSLLDSRSDVLTYTSPPLQNDLHLVGDITLQLSCKADTPSFDVCATLSEVYPTGTVFNFSQGYITVKPEQKTQQLTIPLQSTCICLKQGSAVRLSLSGACFPAYSVNDGTGTPPGKARLIDQQIITLTVNLDGEDGSRLCFAIA